VFLRRVAGVGPRGQGWRGREEGEEKGDGHAMSGAMGAEGQLDRK